MGGASTAALTMDDFGLLNLTFVSNVTVVLLPEERQWLTVAFAITTALGLLINLLVLVYILVRRLFRNFVSSHFIGHLSFTNLISCAYLLPIFIQNVHYGVDLFATVPRLCQFHAFVTCAIWSVIYYMSTCVAGVHLLTFARIHYDQLFGLHPSIICFLSWLIGVSLGLPCLTNSSIVSYDPYYHHCLWRSNYNGYKFLAYLVLLGILLPVVLTAYAYFKVLAIFYHAPIVFQTLGIFKARYLIFAMVLTPFAQLPFFVTRFMPDNSLDNSVYPIIMFLAYAPALINGVVYGLALFMMKEDDMALTARSHKHNTYTAPGVVPAQEV